MTSPLDRLLIEHYRFDLDQSVEKTAEILDMDEETVRRIQLEKLRILFRSQKGPPMKKSLKDQIIKWHEDDLTVDEIAPIIPQCCKPEIEAVIKQYEKDKAWARILTSSRH